MKTPGSSSQAQGTFSPAAFLNYRFTLIQHSVLNFFHLILQSLNLLFFHFFIHPPIHPFETQFSKAFCESNALAGPSINKVE